MSFKLNDSHPVFILLRSFFAVSRHLDDRRDLLNEHNQEISPIVEMTIVL